MSLKRKCYFCGKPVDIRRQMSLFCSARCEALEGSLPHAGQGPRPPPTRGAPHPHETARTRPAAK